MLFVLPSQVPVSGGNSFSGALLYFYATGTTVPATVYTDSARTVAHTNPVQANANGVFDPIWLDPTATYRVRLTTSSGVLLYDVDPYPGTTLSQAQIGAVLYPRTAAEIAASVTPTNYAYPPGDVRRYGAVGDGTTDDTAALQSAATVIAGTGGTILFQPLTYIVSYPGVYVTAGTRLDLNGATIKIAANQANFTRAFRCDGANAWSGSTDSKPLIIENGTIDCNRANQGTYLGFEKQQINGITVSATSASAGKLRVSLRNLNIVESTGDGINLTYNTDASIENVATWNCYRGGITVSGGGHVICVKNYRNGGDVHQFGLNMEPTATPGTAIYATFEDMVVGDTLEFSTSNCPGSVVTVRNIVQTGVGLNIAAAAGSKFRFSDCIFRTAYATDKSRITNIYDAEFVRCKFTLTDDGSATAYGVYWTPTAGTGAQKIIFRDCAFTTDGGFAGADTIYAFYVSQALNTDAFSGEFYGCAWTSEWDYALRLRGGSWTFDNCTVDCDFITATGANGTDNNTLSLGSLKIAAGKKTINTSGSSVPVALTFHSHEVSAGDGTAGAGSNVLDFAGFTNVTTPSGRRVLYVSGTPSGGALAGDIAFLMSPTAGAVNSWVATTSSNTAATWKAATTLAA